MSKIDGEPAFPQHEWSKPGMTLRDYFAAAALAGLASVAFKFIAGEGDMTAAAEQVKNEIAPVAFSIADAMLAERDRA